MKALVLNCAVHEFHQTRPSETLKSFVDVKYIETLMQELHCCGSHRNSGLSVCFLA